MVFSSLSFIYVFTPIFLLVYFFTKEVYRNLVLLVASLIFYTCGVMEHISYLFLIIVSIIFNYAVGALLDSVRRNRGVLLFIGIVYNFFWLFMFKYADFLLGDILNITRFNMILPIGISFYTFQSVSYLIDVYRRDVRHCDSLIDLATYICMFPQLIAGPIVSYSEIKNELNYRKVNISNISDGLKLFIVGLGLKVILANQIGNLWTDIGTIGFDSISQPLAWLGALAFTLQIYFDFYGYSIMAIGLGKIMGFKLPDNFNYPYISVTMTEFWRRWHITLGRWFREYLYIPLGGNRGSSIRTYFNLLVVWFATGLWHGASWNFILWGLFLFVIITIEKIFLAKIFNRMKWLGHIYMIILIPVSWMIFAITDISQLGIYLEKMFIFNHESALFVGDYIKYLTKYGALLLIGIVFSTPLPRIIYDEVKDNWIGILLTLIILGVSIYLLCLGLNNPFLYFRF